MTAVPPLTDADRAAPSLNGDRFAGLLDRVHTFLGRFVAYPSPHAQVAHTLWIAHTHLMDAWESTPRIAFLSPEPGSGKTRALEVSELLVPRPVEAINATPAYLFRKVSDEAGPPTILFDEIDTLFGPKAKDNEEIRGVLNAGHRRGAMAGRCVVKGKTITTEELPAYCAVAVAGLGGLPDTLLSRSVIVPMRRRAPDEPVEPYRRRVHAPEGHRLRDDLEQWAEEIEDQVTNAWPAMPDGIHDRDADVWEALLAVADAAGGGWADRARVSAVTLVTASKAATPSLGVRLLADVRSIFGQVEVMFTTDLLRELISLDEAPWANLRGKALDARGLSTRLGKYGVKPISVRFEAKTAKGYRRVDLHDPWSRYLQPPLRTPSPCIRHIRHNRHGCSRHRRLRTASLGAVLMSIHRPRRLRRDRRDNLAVAYLAAKAGGCRCDPDLDHRYRDGIASTMVSHDGWCPMADHPTQLVVRPHPDRR